MGLLKWMLATALVLDVAMVAVSSANTAGVASQTVGYSMENNDSLLLPIRR